MLKNFRFNKPLQDKEEDIIIDVDEDIELEDEFVINDDMNEIEAIDLE